jgi:hypothetical protein
MKSMDATSSDIHIHKWGKIEPEITGSSILRERCEKCGLIREAYVMPATSSDHWVYIEHASTNTS